MAFRQIKTPALANQSVINTKLSASAVSGQATAGSVESLSNDSLLMYSQSTDTLRKLPVANLLSSVTTDNIAEGTNLYFTNARAQSAVASNIAVAVADEAALRTAADNTLQSNIDDTNAELTTTQTSIGVNADGTFTAGTGTYIGSSTSVMTSIEDLDAGLVQEVADRTSADANLQSQIDNILSNTDPVALDSLTEIVAEFQNADSGLTAAINANATAIANETTRAQGAESTLTTNLASTQSELDTTQAGAGLSATGTYVANGSANYISTATSLNDADVKLDAAVKAMDTAYKAADTTINNSISGLDTRLTTAEADIDTNTADLASEVTRATAREDAIESNLNAEITARGTAVQAARDYSDAQDELLIGDNTVDGSAGNTITDRIATALSSANSYTDTAESDAITSSNAYTDQQIANLNSGVAGDLSGVQTEINTIETGAGLASDGSYSANGSANYISTATSLKDADNKLDAALKTEETARTTADTNLQNQIDNIISNTSQDAIDSFTEVVAAFQDADNGLNGLISANQTAISTEATTRASADTTLQGNIDSEASTRAAADTTLQSNIDAEATARTNADSAIQTELDDTQTGAGLETDGSYSANGSANFVSTATSLKDADNKLDAALYAEQQARISGDATHTAGIAANVTAIATNAADIVTNANAISAEQTRAEGAEADLAQDISDLQDEVDATQTGAGLGADGSYTANGSSNYLTAATSLKDADNKLDTQVKTNADAIAQEVSDRTNAVSAEATARTSADNALQTAIDNEVTRATTAEGALDTRVTANEGDIATLQSDLTSETGARETADSAINAELTATQTGAGLNANGTYAGNTGTNYIDGATSLANADVVLDTQLKATDARVDALLAGSTESFDTLNEIVTAFENADSNLNSAISTLASDASTARSAIQTELDNTQTGAGLGTSGTYTADATKTYIDDASSLFNADQQLDDAIVAEVTARTNADNAIDAFTGAGTSLDTSASTLAGAVNEIVSSISSLDGGTATDLSAIKTSVGLNASGSYVAASGSNYIDSATTVKNADELLDAAIAQEVADRTTAVTNEATARSDEDASIRTDFAAADTAIQQELDATQTGAGLGANGAYTANGSANYISTATSLKDADNKLDAQVKSNADAIAQEVSDRTSAVSSEASTRASADTTLQNNIDAEATARANADTNLQTQVTSNLIEITATQSGAGLATDGTYTANSGTNYIDAASSLKNADSLLDTAIAAEVTRASGEESRIEGLLTTEVSRATTAESGLTTAINGVASDLATEVSRATAAEADLQSQISSIVSNTDPAALDSLTEIVAAFESADSNLTTLVGNNQTAITTEVSDRQAADTTLQNNINAEATARAAADTTLQNNIDTKLALAGGSMTGVIAMGSNKITGLANGTDANDAVNKSQLDAVSSALDLSNFSTTDLSEGTNLYYTDTRARAAISVVDTEGNGDISYNSSTGVITADLRKSLLELTDVADSSYTSKADHVLIVKSDETGVELIPVEDLPIFGQTYRQVIDGTGTATTFAMDFQADDVSTLVFVGGVIQDPTTHYTIDTANQEITFTSAIPVGTQAVIVARELVGAQPYVADNSLTADKFADGVKLMNAGNNNAVTTSGTVIDSFDSSVYRSAKYLIQADNGAGEFETREALVITDGSNAYITEFGIIYTGSAQLGNASVQMNGTSLELVYTAAASGTSAKIVATYVDA